MSAQVDSLLGLCGVRADAGQVLIVVRDDEVLGVGVLRIAAPGMQRSIILTIEAESPSRAR